MLTSKNFLKIPGNVRYETPGTEETYYKTHLSALSREKYWSLGGREAAPAHATREKPTQQQRASTAKE